MLWLLSFAIPAGFALALYALWRWAGGKSNASTARAAALVVFAILFGATALTNLTATHDYDDAPETVFEAV